MSLPGPGFRHSHGSQGLSLAFVPSQRFLPPGWEGGTGPFSSGEAQDAKSSPDVSRALPPHLYLSVWGRLGFVWSPGWIPGCSGETHSLQGSSAPWNFCAPNPPVHSVHPASSPEPERGEDSSGILADG